MTGNKSIREYFGDTSELNESERIIPNRTVIIMDEVDGMSSSDRGGIAALIQIIKNTKSPIICICNDRQSPKVRSLANHCYDLKFSKPSKDLILNRVMRIAQREKIDIEREALEYIILGSGQDLRQVINMLQMWNNSRLPLTICDIPQKFNYIKKDQACMINGMEAAGRILNSQQFKPLGMREKLNLFFIDFNLIPLLIFV